MKQYGGDSVIQMSELGTMEALPVSQSLAEELCNKGAVLEPDAGNEYVVIGCDPAHVLHLWPWGMGSFGSAYSRSIRGRRWETML